VVLGTEVPLRSPARGQIAWALEPGSEVHRGDRVLEIDAREAQLSLAEVEAQVRAAEAEAEFEKRNLEQELAELRARQEEARVRYAQASESVERGSADLSLDQYLSDSTTQLYDLALVSKHEREKAEHSRKVSEISVSKGKAVLQNRRAQVAQIDSIVEAHFKVMAQREELAKARLAALERKRDRFDKLVEDLVIVAPTDGVVAYLHTPLGAHVSPGDVLVTILDDREMSVAVFVPEEELSNVSLAKAEQVKVRFKSYPMKVVEANVIEEFAEISGPLAQHPSVLSAEQLGRQGLVLASRVEVARSPFPLRPGMTGTVLLDRRGLLWPAQLVSVTVGRVLGL
jgi:membrane fusion protein (multidrug efflux system)